MVVDKRELQGRQNIPTVELLNLSGDLSIHQLGALRTLNLTKKIILTQKPSYLAQRLMIPQDRGTRSGGVLPQENLKLGLAREGFIYRGIKLYNLLPDDLKQETKMSRFKKATKKWIKETIPVRP